MKTILIVDDETDIRRVYGQLLRSRGYHTLTASNATDAREVLKYMPVDLMLLDINLGSTNGNYLSDISSVFHPELKIIVSSVYPIDEQKKLVPGLSEYFDKSDSLKTLIRKVDTVLSVDTALPVKGTILFIKSERNDLTGHYNKLVRAGYDWLEATDNLSMFKMLKENENLIELIVLEDALSQMNSFDILNIVRLKYPLKKIMICGDKSIPDLWSAVPSADYYFDYIEGEERFVQQIKSVFASKHAAFQKEEKEEEE